MGSDKINEIIIYTDGGAIGNPGKAAIGVLIKFNNKTKKYFQEIGLATNNQAEYSAIIFALNKIKQIFGKDKISNLKITLNTDSELVANQLNYKFKVKDRSLVPYFIKAHNLKLDFKNITINLINRRKNLADKLVKLALFNKFSPNLRNY